MKSLSRSFFIIFNYCLKLWWYIIRPKTEGVKVLLIYNDEILLIKNTYSDGYTLPGGGIKKNESQEEAARREVFEEVGIHVTNLTPLSSFITHEEYKEDTVYSYYSEVSSKEVILDKFEVSASIWRSINNLPKVGLVTNKILDLYFQEIKGE